MVQTCDLMKIQDVYLLKRSLKILKSRKLENISVTKSINKNKKKKLWTNNKSKKKKTKKNHQLDNFQLY